MTQQEFTSRTMVEVSTEEFKAINLVYMNCDLDKDEFCAMWRKMNASRVKEAKAQAKAQKELERKKDYKWKLIHKLESKVESAFRRNPWYENRASLFLSDKEKDFLDAEGIDWNYNLWGGRVSPFDVIFDLKKSMGVA